MSSDGRVSLVSGYILHRRPYRDTSFLLEAFTADHGRVGLVSRGGRGPRSKTGGLLQPFVPLLLSWSGRGELRTLTGVEPGGRPAFPRGAALAAGFYLNELMMRLLQRHDPHPSLFSAYAEAVSSLANGMAAEWSLRLFERDLLTALGYGLLLTETAEPSEPVQPQRSYCYHLELGPVPDTGTGGIVVSGSTLLALAGGEAPAADGLREAKQLMRAALRLYLGDKPLASRTMFKTLAAGDRSGSDEKQKGE